MDLTRRVEAFPHFEDPQNSYTATFILDSRLLPLICSCVSLIRLIAGYMFQCLRLYRSTKSANEAVPPPGNSIRSKFESHIRSHGGYTIFRHIIRLIGVLALLYLSTLTPIGTCETNLGWSKQNICLEYCIPITLIYSFILAIISLASTSWSGTATSHNIVILLLIFGVYTYRDIWPLATYNLEPADNAEGQILWIKIAALGFSAIIIPLLIPRPYIPADPQRPMPSPSPEQTVSWISRLTYGYVDSVIILANKVSHLSFNQLPPLLDVDHAEYQTKQAFRYLDPFCGAKPRHLFFGMMYYFQREYFIIAVCIFIQSMCSFSGPIAIKQILNHLETAGSNATLKPWLWIIILFGGSLLESIITHWNLYLQTIIRVRVQALLTQLVFEHSLRIRVKVSVSREEDSLQAPNTSGGHEETSRVSTPLPDDAFINAQSGHTSQSGTEDQTPSIVAPEGEQTLDDSVKGKGKSDPNVAVTPQPANEPTTDVENLIGRINNLVTSDLDTIVEGINFLDFIIYVPLQLVLSIIFLTNVLGWSALVGFFATIVLTPVPGYIAKKVQDLQRVRMKKTDARVQNISETIDVIRMVKLFGWETKTLKKIAEKREEELYWMWKIDVLRALNGVASVFIPTFVMLLSYGIYTMVMKRDLSASKVFSSMAVFTIMKGQISRIIWQSSSLLQVKVSLDRLTHFLQTTELLDQFKDGEQASASSLVPFEEDDESIDIGLRNASFAWSDEDEGILSTPSSRHFTLRIDGELLFRRDCINLITGPTGSGKTSILMALLGEMHFIPLQANSWFNLPRRGGVAYAAQESWVQSATIRDNILFGSVYDEERYKKVIHQCALEHDLELFDAGDKTEVGERGITLSGGQKARVTLARAIYSSAEIILLDDILAALDVHTSAWIVDKCFRGDLVKRRTIVLVTHNITLVGPIAGFIVSLGLKGGIQTRSIVLETEVNQRIQSEVYQETRKAEEGDGDIRAPPADISDGKLVVAEEITEGRITWKSMELLISALGGRNPILFFIVVAGVIMVQIMVNMQTWFLGVWASQYEIHAPSDVRLSFYLSMLLLIVLGHLLVFSSLDVFFNYRSIGASRTIHAKLLDSIFRSTLRWLDETPTGRIIARCTQDISIVDHAVPVSLFLVLDQSIGLIIKLGVIVLFTPIFIFPGGVVVILGLTLGNLYLKAQLPMKREMSNARSPVLSHFNSAIHDLVSIRAYRAQEAFKQESLKRIDHYSRIARTSWNVNRWVGLRMDFLGAMFTASLAFYLVYGQTVGAANTGFSLNMASGFCSYIFSLIRMFNELEVESNSLERIQGYLDIEHEPKPTESGKPPAAWPASGDLRVENLSARYSESGPKVLHDLSFHIFSGQRIGIVGRTGSGKSSLTLALLRCLITEGTVYYDGLPTSTINLDALRSSITIIPQTPELLSGTLRQNLDPFKQNDDVTLNNALRAAGLFSLQAKAGEARITLDSMIASGGSNLSVGQRQIIALARAIVRGSKLVILDEATSAIDYKTDTIIQSTLRSQLDPDVTVITVAHRLQTIMDADKIMVLDKGHIVEFDSPQTLLRKERGALRTLVEGSGGDKDALYELAGGI